MYVWLLLLRLTAFIWKEPKVAWQDSGDTQLAVVAHVLVM
jgi:hypothetical protein